LTAAVRHLLRRPWPIAIAGAASGLAALHLSALATAPPGLYNDEASVGYNAWAIAHGGVDEHGVSWPLFFQGFGDYSRYPVYIYVLAPLTRVFPLTASVVRLPAALCGLALCAAAALAAWHISRSRAVSVLTMLTAGLAPWLAVLSRTAFETITMTLALMVAVWCLTAAEAGRRRAAWFAGSGVALGVAIFTYAPPRIFVGMAVVALLVAWLALPPRRPSCLMALPPVGLAYTALLLWGHAHPGALTARFDLLSITGDHAPFATVARRFVGNYIEYLTPSFLFTHGDGNLRHSTGFGGMLMVSTAPVILLGLIACLRRWREPVARFAVLGAVFSPVPAALTMEGTPHALRAATMLPFLLMLTAYGWQELLPLLTRRLLLAAALGLAVAVETGGYWYDLYAQWPARSLAWFDAGEGDAIVEAHAIAAGRTVLLSRTLDAPYIQAYFRLRPDPPMVARRGLAAVGMREAGPADLTLASPGDILVLSPQDTPPPGATLLREETVTVSYPLTQVGRPDRQEVLLASIWRR